MTPINRSNFIRTAITFPKERLPFQLSLYLVANRPSYPNERQFVSKILNAVKGGVTCVQLRDHESNLASIIRIASRLKKLLNGVPLFINTRQPIAVTQFVDAEGVYLEKPFPFSEARKQLGVKKIIGIPVKMMEEVAFVSQTNEIDYLSVKVFPSKKTCPNNDNLWGMEGLRSVRVASPHRIVAIGGIHLALAESFFQELLPNDGIAMAGGLMEEESPFLTAQKLNFLLEKIENK